MSDDVETGRGWAWYAPWCGLCHWVELKGTLGPPPDDNFTRERLLYLIRQDFECLPECDSFGHAEKCPYVGGPAQLDELTRQRDATRAENEQLKQDAERFAWYFSYEHTESGALIELSLRVIKGERPTLDECRVAIDAARAADQRGGGR